MKFLHLIAATAAIRLQQKQKLSTKLDHPSAQDIMDACDANQSGGITLQEAHTCIDNMIQDENERQQMHQMVDAHCNQIDTDGSGEVDINELRAVMEGDNDSGSESEDEGPSPREIIETCDTDNSGGLTKEEAHACIDAHVPEGEHRQNAHQQVDEGFDKADKNGDGEVDRKELRRAMRKEKRKAKKGSKGGNDGPSAKQIIETCDTD